MEGTGIPCTCPYCGSKFLGHPIISVEVSTGNETCDESIIKNIEDKLSQEPVNPQTLFKRKYFEDLKIICERLPLNLKYLVFSNIYELEVWFLPNLDELKEYFESLDYDFHVSIWKMILKEFKNKFHNPARNKYIIELLKKIKSLGIVFKTFNIYNPNPIPYLDDPSDDPDTYKKFRHEVKSKNNVREIYIKNSAEGIYEMFRYSDLDISFDLHLYKL